jgi:hypothetical protein
MLNKAGTASTLPISRSWVDFARSAIHQAIKCILFSAESMQLSLHFPSGLWLKKGENPRNIYFLSRKNTIISPFSLALSMDTNYNQSRKRLLNEMKINVSKHLGNENKKMKVINGGFAQCILQKCLKDFYGAARLLPTN